MIARPGHFTLVCALSVIQGCGTATDTATSGPATQLAFQVQPASVAAGSAVTVTIAVQDGAGRTVTSATPTISIALADNSAGAALLGTTQATAVAGKATFSNLRIEKAATAYSLEATAPGLRSARSAVFAVAAGAPAKVSFVVQPSLAEGNVALSPAIQVAVSDGFGNPAQGSNQVTIALGTHASGAKLLGTTSIAAQGGSATFPNLRVDRPGAGYTLTASAASLTSATSAPFDVKLTFASIAAGAIHSCGVTTSGAAYCWGTQPYGLGDGTTTQRSSPILVAGSYKAAAVGHHYSCLLATNGAVTCWGRAESGELGNGSFTSRPVPGIVPEIVATTITAGWYHACALVAAGSARCWGYNITRQLGLEAPDSLDRPSPHTVAGTLQFVAIDAARFHSCALTTQGAAYCWGANDRGQIGNGSTGNHVQGPTAVSGGLTFGAITAGGTFVSGSGRTGHSCALTANGTAHCWGNNWWGELGNNSTTSSSIPVPVAGSIAFKAIAAGSMHTCALTTAGTAYCWGENTNGELGDGTNVQRLTPQLVSGGQAFATISAGDGFTCAVTAAGVAYCWGSNTGGQLGDGTNVSRNTPTRVV